MIKYIIIFLFISTFISCKQPLVNKEGLVIKFNGFKDSFSNKSHLTVEFDSKLINNKVDSLFNASYRKYFCSLRPVLWEANVFRGTEENSDYLFTVISNTENDLNIIKGNKCYKNEKLIELIYKLVNIDAIREYEGQLTQEEYKMIMGRN